MSNQGKSKKYIIVDKFPASEDIGRKVLLLAYDTELRERNGYEELYVIQLKRNGLIRKKAEIFTAPKYSTASEALGIENYVGSEGIEKVADLDKDSFEMLNMLSKGTQIEGPLKSKLTEIIKGIKS